MLSLLPARPTDLGISDKFDHWRNGQKESIEESLFCDKRVKANCAPTGFGKSLCYVTEALMSSGRTCIVTQTKGLEDQVMEDFGSVGLVNIRGKDNYKCVYKPGWSCRDGSVGSCPAREEATVCPYAGALVKTKEARIVVTNTKYWLAMHKYGGGLGAFDQVIFDEADNCPDDLAENVQVALSFREVEEILGSSFPSPSSTGDVWKAWASKARVKCQELFTQKQAQVAAAKSPRPSWISDLHHLKNMVQKFATVALMKAEDWVWEDFDWGWQFDPIKYHRYRESRMFLKIPSVSLYSATIRPKTCHMLGFRNEDFLFMDHPSVFDPERSPVYYIDAMKVDRNSGDLSLLIMRMDQVAMPRLRLGWNGAVHVTSFDYRDTVVKLSDCRSQIVSHWNGSPVLEAVKRYRDQGGLLVSPSITTGYNFRDDECRFVISLKTPFLPRTKVIKAREKADPFFGPYHTMRKLVQGFGRARRSSSDWSENFILDGHFINFYRRYGFFAPREFQERMKWPSGIPRPVTR